MDIGRLLVFLFNIHAVMLMDCDKRLGDGSARIVFGCNTDVHLNDDLIWLRDGMELSGEMKYTFSEDRRRLIVPDIDHSDEGNYSCKYSDSTSTYEAGCLYVYGAAYFTSEENEIYVTEDGNVKFDLSLSFSQPGPSGSLQRIHSFQLRRNDPIIDCFTESSSCVFHRSNQWWTVEGHGHNVMFTLHQMQREHVGTYTAQVVGLDPANNGQTTFMKSLEVDGQPCDIDPPTIDSPPGIRSTLDDISRDNVGNQANYSCSNNCTLQGSSSLRCRRVTIGALNSYFEWVNQSGSTDPPTCFCPGTSVMPTSTSQPTTSYHKKSLSIHAAETSLPLRIMEQSSGLGAAAVWGIVSAVVGTLVVLIVIGILAIWKFRSRRITDSKAQVVCDYPEVDLRKTHHVNNISQNGTAVHSDDRDSYIENVDNEFCETVKNSHSMDV